MQDDPDRMREVLDLARQAEAMKQRAEDADALAERLKLEAQAHAMEARTANSTINEIYQVVSDRNGELGNWHGAAPVREKLEAMKREMAEKDARIAALEEALRPFAEIADVFDFPGGNRPTQGIIAAWSDHRIGERELTVESVRRARALIGGGE